MNGAVYKRMVHKEGTMFDNEQRGRVHVKIKGFIDKMIITKSMVKSNTGSSQFSSLPNQNFKTLKPSPHYGL